MPIPQLKKTPQTWRNQKYNYSYHRAGGGNKKSTLDGIRSKTHRSSRSTGKGVLVWFWSVLKNLFSDPRFLKKFAITSAIFLFIIFIWVARLSSQLPSPNQLIERQVAQSTKIYDRTGETILYEISGDEKRTIVELKELPDYVKWATIAIEDKDFYNHGGFSIWAMFRTAITNIIFHRKAGGSTLTQQFVKNAVLSNEKTYTRKIKELILSYRLEQKFSKDEILQMYFNEIPYGSNAYGIEAASQKYFGKSARDLNLAEAAILASMVQAPSYYSPYGPNREVLFKRQQYVLGLMEEQGYITKDKAEVAKAFKLEFKEPSENAGVPYHFIMYVKQILSEKYGEKEIEQGGLKIYTTLDTYKQKIAEEAIATYAEKNEKNYNAKNAALVSLDPKTGQILAMVGSRDFFNEDIDGQVNIATSLRQPGSSIKPIVYATAFAEGYSPNTVLYDVNTNFSTDPSNPYQPHNYSGGELGPVTMRQALAGSLNIPAVKTMYLAGTKNVIKTAKNLGYTSLNDPDRIGLALVLGGGEVKLLEHANAYSAFAREGSIRPTTAILKVEDRDGNVLEEYKDQESKALDGNVARMVNSVLSDNNARAYVFGAQNYLTLPNRPVAAKTGTTNDYHDAWTIGYTPSLVAGVWVGNSDNEAMKKGADGSVIAAPIWNYYMRQVLGNTPVENFNAPNIPATGKAMLDGNVSGLDLVKIDRASGKLATDRTPNSFVEEKSFSQPHCILYYIEKNDPLGSAPKNPASDPQFSLWESGVQAWAGKKGLATSTETAPTEYDDLHIPANEPSVKINTPENNQVVTDNLNAVINASAPRGVGRAEYYIDDNLIAVVRSYPYNLTEKNLSFLPSGYHTLKVKVCDDIDNCAEDSREFNFTGNKNSKAEPIEVSIENPSNGVALNKTNFPLSIQLNLNNPAQIGRVDLYAIDAKNNIIKINSLGEIGGSIITGAWASMPSPGTWLIYAEAIGWQGQKTESKKISLTINP